MNILVRSSSFKEGECIPKRYTCEGDDISPQLSWTDFPEQTKSFAVMCYDPDEPHETFVQWIVYNIPPEVTQLGEAVPHEPVLSNGARQGKNDLDKVHYSGPCPAVGEHRYYFFVYALDTQIKLNPGVNNAEVKAAMENHIIAEGRIMGHYKMQAESMDEIIDEVIEQVEEPDTTS